MLTDFEISNIPDKLVVMSLEEAKSPYGSFLRNRWKQTSFSEGGVFIYVPPNCSFEEPITISHLTKEQQEPCPRLQLFVGRGACVSFVLSIKSDYVADCVVEKGASVSLTQHSQSTYTIRATVNENAVLQTFSHSQGAHEDYHIQLAGEHAEASLNGIWILEKGSHHVNIHMDHQAPHTRSNQLFKGVLAKSSRSKFEGNITIRQQAQKAEAYQLNKNLLLSDQARAESKPSLNILADDVKASHGATIGQIDKNQLFYLQARGLSEEEAKEMLVEGFLKL